MNIACNESPVTSGDREQYGEKYEQAGDSLQAVFIEIYRGERVDCWHRRRPRDKLSFFVFFVKFATPFWYLFSCFLYLLKIEPLQYFLRSPTTQKCL